MVIKTVLQKSFVHLIKAYLAFVKTLSPTAIKKATIKGLHIPECSTVFLFRIILKPAGYKRKDDTSKG